jgi:hypothetical protein
LPRGDPDSGAHPEAAAGSLVRAIDSGDDIVDTIRSSGVDEDRNLIATFLPRFRRRRCDDQYSCKGSRMNLVRTPAATAFTRSGRVRLVTLATVAGLLSASGAAAQSYVYPAKGQTPDQQKKDESACHTWAVDQSKFDPAKPPPPPATATAPTTATGSTPGAGVRGAARGAIVGEIVADDAGAGAAAGAVAGRGVSRRQNAAQQQQATAQQQQAVSAGQAAYGRARQACLEGRGYTVR